MPANPVRGVKRYRDCRRERFLSAQELARLGEALAEAEQAGESSIAVAGIRLLVLTGARKSEILTARREWVDFDRGLLRLPDSKTGEKVIHLGAAALEVMAKLSCIAGNLYLLPGNKPGTYFVGLPRVWERVRKMARLTDVRLHDLRHSLASIGAIGGDSLLVLGALLGHRTPTTTARYAHLSNDPVKTAADRISRAIEAAMAGGSGAVVKLKLLNS